MRYVIALLLVVLLTGCDSATGQAGNTYDNLPAGATDVAFQGNGWYTFKWSGNCFLMNTNSGSLLNNYDRAMTAISCDKLPEGNPIGR